jgi:hypothetical protein
MVKIDSRYLFKLNDSLQVLYGNSLIRVREIGAIGFDVDDVEPLPGEVEKMIVYGVTIRAMIERRRIDQFSEFAPEPEL